MEEVKIKRPNRHSNPSGKRHGKGRFVFIHKKNREVRDLMRANE